MFPIVIMGLFFSFSTEKLGSSLKLFEFWIRLILVVRISEFFDLVPIMLCFCFQLFYKIVHFFWFCVCFKKFLFFRTVKNIIGQWQLNCFCNFYFLMSDNYLMSDRFFPIKHCGRLCNFSEFPSYKLWVNFIGL